MTRIDFDFAGAFEAAEFYDSHEKFPTLVRAAENSVPARSPRVEWVDEDGNERRNFCEIFRSPYALVRAASISDEEGFYDGDDLKHLRVKTLLEHLRRIEKTLLYGEAGEETHPKGYPKRWMGGTQEFLGRKPRKKDRLVLRPAPGRELVLREWTNPGGSIEGEWLSELSLEVHAG